MSSGCSLAFVVGRRFTCPRFTRVARAHQAARDVNDQTSPQRDPSVRRTITDALAPTAPERLQSSQTTIFG